MKGEYLLNTWVKRSSARYTVALHVGLSDGLDSSSNHMSLTYGKIINFIWALKPSILKEKYLLCSASFQRV